MQKARTLLCPENIKQLELRSANAQSGLFVIAKKILLMINTTRKLSSLM